MQKVRTILAVSALALVTLVAGAPPAQAHGSCTVSANLSIGPTGNVNASAGVSCSTIHNDTHIELNLWADPLGSAPPMLMTSPDKTTHNSTTANLSNSVFNCVAGGTGSGWYVIASSTGQRQNGGSWHNGGVKLTNTKYCPV